MLRKTVRKATQFLFALWARLHKSPAGSWQSYPQTWGLKGWHRPSKALCHLLIGHEISLTETSYSGGDWATKYCRWCNESIRIPARESEFVDRWGSIVKGT